jgi:hypothetical protein
VNDPDTKPTALQEKRQKILEERISRKVNENPGMTREEAHQAILAGDWEKLTIEKKLSNMMQATNEAFARVEAALNELDSSHSVLRECVQVVHENQKELAKAVDIIDGRQLVLDRLVRALVAPEQYAKVQEEVSKELAEEQARRQAEEAAKMPSDEEENQFPEGATVFGG